MKDKILVLLFSMMMVISLCFVFANETYAKPCPVDSKCTNCLEHKKDCCNHCSKNCKDCKDCCKDCNKCCNKTKVTTKDDCDHCNKDADSTKDSK